MATSTIKGKQDTGWKSLLDGKVYYRIIEGICYVLGADIQATHNVAFATMPPEARPSRRWTVPAAFPLQKNIYINMTTGGPISAIVDGGGEISNLYFETAYPVQ